MVDNYKKIIMYDFHSLWTGLMMQTLSPNKFFFCHNTILAGLKRLKRHTEWGLNDLRLK